jgi:hypothetical protein
MTYPAVDDLPEEAASTLLDVCGQLSQSRHAGLARWAASVSDALLVRLVTVTIGAPVDVTDIEPCRPLAELDGAELESGIERSGRGTPVVPCRPSPAGRSRCFLTVSRFASAGVCRGWYRRKLRELPERSGVYVFVNRQDECFDGTVEIIDVLMTRLFTIDQWLY